MLTPRVRFHFLSAAATSSGLGYSSVGLCRSGAVDSVAYSGCVYDGTTKFILGRRALLPARRPSGQHLTDHERQRRGNGDSKVQALWRDSLRRGRRGNADGHRLHGSARRFLDRPDVLPREVLQRFAGQVHLGGYYWGHTRAMLAVREISIGNSTHRMKPANNSRICSWVGLLTCGKQMKKVALHLMEMSDQPG